MLSKVYYVYFDAQNMTESTHGYWWIIRIIHYRIGFMFLTLSSYFIFVFKGKIFEKSISKTYHWFMIAFLIFILMFLLLIFDINNILYPILSFGFVFIYTSIVYFPMMIKSYQISKKIVDYDPNFRSAFLSLSVMCFCFIMLFVFFIIDQIIHMINGATYTLFYFIGWLFVFLGEIFAYYGYIRPKSKE